MFSAERNSCAIIGKISGLYDREQASCIKSGANLYNMIHLRRDALQFRQPAVNTERQVTLSGRGITHQYRVKNRLWKMKALCTVCRIAFVIIKLVAYLSVSSELPSNSLKAENTKYSQHILECRV